MDHTISLSRYRLVAGNIPPKRQRSISLFDFSKKDTINGPSIDSVLFRNVRGHAGKDNPAFVNDHESLTQQWTGSSNILNANGDSTFKMASTSVSKVDEQPVLDMKEEDETNVAGTVTWRLYWKYFKEGSSVPIIMLLAVLLISAQGNY